MDEIVAAADLHLLQPFLPLQLEGYLPLGCFIRQIYLLYLILILGGTILYLGLSSLTYYLFFKLWKDYYYPPSAPQPFEGQPWKEIDMALRSIPNIAHLTVPFFLLELRGFSKLHGFDPHNTWLFALVSIFFFIIWSDSLIYWIHRWLHEIPFLYQYVHKPHHLWKVPTPYASVAFHPIDGWLQSVPYHIYPFLFPMNKWLHLVLFIFVQVWTVMIHDGVHLAPFSFINGAAHHSFHHQKFVFNYGQYFTFWDRLCGTHMDPCAKYDREKKDWVIKE